jgi:carboxyl-terminal processing protease
MHRDSIVKHTRPVVVIVVALTLSMASPSQEHSRFKTLTNIQVQQMLDMVEADIKNYYYDASMHGLDLDKTFDSARGRIADAKSQNEGLLQVAGAVAALKDSHTRFSPPVAPYGVDYGWQMQAIGDSDCYVTAVRRESDAEAKGLRPGDQVASINGIRLTREDIKYVEYGYRVFPQSGLRLVVKSPNGSERPLLVTAKIISGQPFIRGVDLRTWLRNYRKQEDRSRYHRVGNQVLFWKLPDFILEPSDLDGPLDKIRTFSTIVLDLRGNPGGRIGALEKFIGGFFDHDVKIGDRKERKKSEAQIAKSKGRKSFAGRVIVLLDSRSSSAAEIFARVVQLEKRGIVLGDRSAGAVMESNYYAHAVELDPRNVTQYGTMITIADLVLGDGKSLENVGVTPDERIVPAASDIAAGRDTVLARAAELAGTKMSADEAGRIFPFEWPDRKRLKSTEFSVVRCRPLLGWTAEGGCPQVGVARAKC